MTRLYVPSPWIGPGMARVRRQRPTHSRHVNLHVGALTSPDLHAFMNFTPRCIRELRDTVNITEFLHSETVNKWQNRLTIIIYICEISAKILSLFWCFLCVKNHEKTSSLSHQKGHNVRQSIVFATK